MKKWRLLIRVAAFVKRGGSLIKLYMKMHKVFSMIRGYFTLFVAECLSWGLLGLCALMVYWLAMWVK